MNPRIGTALLAAAFFAYTVPADATAETYGAANLTAAQIFQRARDARGKLEPGAYIEVAHAVGGGMVETLTTVSSGDDWRTTEEGGGYTSASGYFKGQSWTQNENGIVTLRSNFRTREDPNSLALRHPEDPKYNVRVLGTTQSLPEQYVVEVNPPGGSDQYRYYTAATFLLSSIVTFSKDRYRHVTEYCDYRKVFGEVVAFKRHSYDGRPNNDEMTTVERYERTAAPPPLAIPASHPLYTLTGNAPLTLPTTFTRGGIILHTSVNGRGLDFILDSGASGMFIDPGVAHELGLTQYGKRSETIGGGDIDEGTVRIPSMQIGPLTMNGAVFTTTPYTEQVGDARAVGLIGFDFISSGVTEVDFRDQTVRVYPRQTFDPASMGLLALPAQLDDGIARVPASMEGIDGHFLIDTGAFGMMLYRNYMSKLPQAPTVRDSFRMGTVGGTMDASVHAVTDFVFGGIRFEHADVVVPSTSTFDISDYDGIIGRDALAAYRVFFDFQNNMVYVKRNI